MQQYAKLSKFFNLYECTNKKKPRPPNGNLYVNNLSKNCKSIVTYCVYLNFYGRWKISEFLNCYINFALLLNYTLIFVSVKIRISIIIHLILKTAVNCGIACFISIMLLFNQSIES